MPSTSARRNRQAGLRWYQRRSPSTLVLIGLLAAVALMIVGLARSVADVLPEVGKDAQGDDPWKDPVGMELLGPYTAIRVPDCALAPIERIVLWDEDSEPYWEVSGPPVSLNTIVLGAAPAGFTVETEYRQPPKDAVLRVGIVRSNRGMAGVRFRLSDLRAGYVATGQPINRYPSERFQTGDFCADEGEGEGGSTTTDPTVEAPEANTTLPE